MFKFFIRTIVPAFCFFCYLSAENIENPQNIEVIDNRIKELKTKLAGIRLKTGNVETESQEYMIADWKEYTKEMEGIKAMEGEGRELIKQIHELEQRKSELLKHNLK